MRMMFMRIYWTPILAAPFHCWTAQATARPTGQRSLTQCPPTLLITLSLCLAVLIMILLAV